jgi:hypothetical protein
MLADTAADQDVMKVFDECQQDGWSNTGYQKVMNKMCDKIADKLIENRSGLLPKDGVILTAAEEAFKHMGDLISATDSGSKLLGAIAGKDAKAAGKELFNFATDNTGALGKALKYTLQGMQNALDAWRDAEVQKAFQVYKNGSPGTLFGYGAVEALKFDDVWENMKGASRQLCIERIAIENDARRLAGMKPLSPREEDFYRAKVKEELRTEFERRIKVQEKIDKEKKGLDLIFEELDKGDLLDSSKVWYRGFGGKEETLKSRMGRMEHLIQRIYKDLGIKSVYSGPQNTKDINGSISAAAMSEMIRLYFAANTVEDAEKALQEYYKKSFNVPKAKVETTETTAAESASTALTNQDLAGLYSMTGTNTDGTVWTDVNVPIHPSGSSGGTLGKSSIPYTFSGNTVTWINNNSGVINTWTIKFTKSGSAITGQGTLVVFTPASGDFPEETTTFIITMKKTG